jgi:uncharacterized protein YbaA (DUF1428 family)
MSRKTLDRPETENDLSKTSHERARETAYIYNGFGDLSLPYLGAYTYDIPYGEVTEIHSVEHREVDQSKSFDGTSVYMSIHLPGESIARELIETRQFNQKGCAVFFDGPDVSPALKEKCDSEGERFILGEIEAFKINREKAKAGTAGYKIKPDHMVYEWMRKYTPDDEVFASQSHRTSQASQTASAINKLTDIADRLTRQQETPPEPVVEESEPEPKPKRGRPRKTSEETKAS